MLNVKSILCSAVVSCVLFVAPTIVKAEHIQQLTSLGFGTIIQRPASCTMDPTTGVITSPNDSCLTTGTLGRFTIYGDASTTIQIRLLSGNDAGNGITFYPTARFTNNVGDDVTNLITGSYSYVDTGTDGRINVWVGGIIDLSQNLNAATPYTLDWDIEYTQQ